MLMSRLEGALARVYVGSCLLAYSIYSPTANGDGINDNSDHGLSNGLTHISDQTKAAVAANSAHEVNGLQSPPAETDLLKPASPDVALPSTTLDAPPLTSETAPQPITSIIPESDKLIPTQPLAVPETSLPPATQLHPVTSESGNLPLMSTVEPPVEPPAEPTIEPSAPAFLIQPAPTSELRESTEPASAAQASEIREEKHQRDLEADRELSNGLAQSDTAPIPRTLTPPAPSQPSAMADDAMDTSETVSLPHHPATPSAPSQAPEQAQTLDVSMTSDTVDVPSPTPLPPPVTEVTAPPSTTEPPAQNEDHVMRDVPPSPNKVARSREDESTDEAPATKRTRTDDDGSAAPEFKMPDVPPSQALTETPSQPAFEETKQPSVEAPSQLSINTALPAETDSAMTASALPTANGTDKILPPGPRPDNADHKVEMTTLQQKALRKLLSDLKKYKYSTKFSKPVNPVAEGIPNYPDIVKSPMDLETIGTRLKANEYRTVADFIADFDQIITNVTTFNGPDHFVSQQGYKMAQKFEDYLGTVPGPNEQEPEKKKKLSQPKPPPQRRESRSSAGVPKTPAASSPTQTFAVGSSGVPQIRRDSTVATDRPKREIHPPPPRDVQYEKPRKKKFHWELKFCQDVIDELFKPRYAQYSFAFEQPVDPVSLNIPNYLKVIKKPMDMSTIRNKLKMGEYENAKEFEADWRLMFSNCYKFNPADHPVHRAGKALEEIFDERWKSKKQWIRDHAPPSGAQSPESSPEPETEDEEDEEEEEEDEPPPDQIDLMVSQIERMQKAVEAMKKSKSKPSKPSGGKKKGAAKPAKKDASKAGKGGKKDAGGKKTKKKEKTPYVTYEQKQDISLRINNLPETRMNQALSIIRDNMPTLSVSSLSTSLPTLFLFRNP